MFLKLLYVEPVWLEMTRYRLQDFGYNVRWLLRQFTVGLKCDLCGENIKGKYIANHIHTKGVYSRKPVHHNCGLRNVQTEGKAFPNRGNITSATCGTLIATSEITDFMTSID